jgi:hypothetical protein
MKVRGLQAPEGDLEGDELAHGGRFVRIKNEDIHILEGVHGPVGLVQIRT